MQRTTSTPKGRALSYRSLTLKENYHWGQQYNMNLSAEERRKHSRAFRDYRRKALWLVQNGEYLYG